MRVFGAFCVVMTFTFSCPSFAAGGGVPAGQMWQTSKGNDPAGQTIMVPEDTSSSLINSGSGNVLNKGCWRNVLAAPAKMAGVVWGVALGIPLRSTKYIASESRRMTQTLLDDFGGPGPFNTLFAGAFAVPYGIASGTVLGLIRGAQYGWQYGASEPFSRKSIGLGEPCLVGQR